MASGQSVAIIYQITPPGANYATLDTRAGGSTPAENVPVYDFDASTAEYLDYYCQMMSNYSGGGITLQIKWSATSATSGDCIWRAAFRRIADNAEDVDTSKSYDYNSITVAPANVSGEVKYDTITFTSGADMDSVTAGDMFILRIGRDAANGNDDMAGDAELHYIVVTET